MKSQLSGLTLVIEYTVPDCAGFGSCPVVRNRFPLTGNEDSFKLAKPMQNDLLRCQKGDVLKACRYRESSEPHCYPVGLQNQE